MRLTGILMMLLGAGFVVFGYSEVSRSVAVINLQSNLIGVGLFIAGAVFYSGGVIADAIETRNLELKATIKESTMEATAKSESLQVGVSDFPKNLSDATKALLAKATSLGYSVQTLGQKIVVSRGEAMFHAYSESDFKYLENKIKKETDASTANTASSKPAE